MKAPLLERPSKRFGSSRLETNPFWLEANPFCLETDPFWETCPRRITTSTSTSWGSYRCRPQFGDPKQTPSVPPFFLYMWFCFLGVPFVLHKPGKNYSVLLGPNSSQAYNALSNVHKTCCPWPGLGVVFQNIVHGALSSRLKRGSLCFCQVSTVLLAS